MRRSTIPVLAILLCSLPLFAGVRLQPGSIDGLKYIILTEDFNGDGLDDVFTWNALQLNLGNGKFTPPIDIEEIPGPANMDHPDVGVRAATKINGDAYADLYVVREQGTDLVLLGTGNGSFRVKAVTQEIGYVQDVFDFTGDGLADVLSWRPGEILLQKGAGDGTFALVQTLPWEGSYYMNGAPPVADFNSDGRMDFVIGTDESFLFHYAQADGTFAVQERYARNGPTKMKTGDLNGDGHVDIGFLAGAGDQMAISVIYGDGTGRFPGYTRLIVTDNPWAQRSADGRSIAIADFVEGGADEFVFPREDGTIIVLSGMNEQLREVATVKVDAVDLDVQPMRFRSATPELVAHGYRRWNDNRFAFIVSPDGAIEPVQALARERAMDRLNVTAAGGTYSLTMESDCPMSLTELAFEREGLFVNVEQTAEIESGRAAYLPDQLYLELQVKDSSGIRVLSGRLLPTVNGLEGKLFEWNDTPCGRRWGAHHVTGIAMR